MKQDTTDQTGAVEWRRVFLGRRPRLALYRALFLAVLCFVAFKFFVMLVKVDGRSMAPTFRDGSVHLLNRLAYSRSKPQRGDVVAVRTTGVHNMYLKRIVGLPGEEYMIIGGVVFINGKPLDEPYVKARESWESPPTTLKEDQYVVIGDNRGMDQRLHSFGEIREWQIVGKVIW